MQNFSRRSLKVKSMMALYVSIYEMRKPRARCQAFKYTIICYAIATLLLNVYRLLQYLWQQHKYNLYFASFIQLLGGMYNARRTYVHSCIQLISRSSAIGSGKSRSGTLTFQFLCGLPTCRTTHVEKNTASLVSLYYILYHHSGTTWPAKLGGRWREESAQWKL